MKNFFIIGLMIVFLSQNGYAQLPKFTDKSLPEQVIVPPAPQEIQIGQRRIIELIPLNKVELIKRLIEINGARATIVKTFTQLVDKAPEDQKEWLSLNLKVDEFVLELVPIYDQYYTEEEIKQLIQFYATPLGVKVLKIAPDLLDATIQTTLAYLQKVKVLKAKTP